MIVSDILITADVDESIRLPTNNFDITPYLEPGPKPVKLNSKTLIIQNTLCVCFAGSVSEIVEFIYELKMRCSYFKDELTFEHIKDFLADYDFQNKFSSSECLLLYAEKKELSTIIHEITFPENSWEAKTTPIFDKVIAGGSGKGDFVHWMATRYIESNNHSNPGMQSFTLNGTYITNLLATERLTLHTVKHFWGAAFELTAFNGKQFQKIDNISYIIFKIFLDESGDIRAMVPSLIMHNRYLKDILFVSAIEPTNYFYLNRGDIDYYMIDKGSCRCHAVPPLDNKELCSEDIPLDYSFSTNNVGVGYILISKKTIAPASYFTIDPKVSVIYKNQRVRIMLHKPLTAEVLSKVKEIYLQANK